MKLPFMTGFDIVVSRQPDLSSGSDIGPVPRWELIRNVKDSRDTRTPFNKIEIDDRVVWFVIDKVDVIDIRTESAKALRLDALPIWIVGVYLGNIPITKRWEELSRGDKGVECNVDIVT